MYKLFDFHPIWKLSHNSVEALPKPTFAKNLEEYNMYPKHIIGVLI